MAVLLPIYLWDKTLKQYSEKISDKIIIESENIKLTNRTAGNYYKGFDLTALCRYEELASLNLSLGDYKSRAMDYIDTFIDVFNNYKIDKVISWNPVLSFRRIPLVLAQQHNIETQVIDYSAFKDRFIIAKNDVSVFSKFYNDYVNFYRYIRLTKDQEAEINIFIENYKKDKITRISDENCEKITDIKDFSLVILQVQNDANILYYQNGLVNNNTILEYLNKHNNKKYLIRNHPLTENKEEIKEYFNSYDFVDNYKMHDLLENCNEVITINSSVGVEALCYNKPVICLGNAMYNKVISNKHFLWYYINKFTIKYDDI